MQRLVGIHQKHKDSLEESHAGNFLSILNINPKLRNTVKVSIESVIDSYTKKGNSNIKKALVAPNLSKKSNSEKNKNKKTLASNIKKIKKIVEENFDYVGDSFSEEAKKIKYGETKDRPIYGEATVEQTKELLEEDINVTPLPFQSNKKIN